MKFRFIHQERRWYGVDNLCRAMGVTRGGYWSWLGRRAGPRQQADAVLLADIRRIYKEKRRTYGSPRIHDQLQKEGKRHGRKRIERLMREHDMRAKQSKKFKPATTDSKHDHPVAPNVLDRRFHWEHPNQAWVTDLTCIPTEKN